VLIVLRGNSGSGKTTVATALQRELGWPTAVLGQDHFRRIVYAEREQEHLANADLLAAAAAHCLAAAQSVVLEGVFNASRYAPMLERIAARTADARFFSFDLSLAETLRRHAERQHPEVTVEMLSDWYHGWQPLPFVSETRIGADETVEQIVDRIVHGCSPMH
jgi:predicted kinase